MNSGPQPLSPPFDPLPAAADTDARIMLGVLTAVHEDSHLTQRLVAGRLDIALGLANAYIKRCLKKGYIKVSQIPKRRYAYYLTPQGMAEKCRLSAEFLTQTFMFFKAARDQVTTAFDHCHEKGWSRVALWGDGELADVAELCSHAHAITLAGIIDWRALEVTTALDADAVLVTDLADPYGAYRAAIDRLPAERVLIPRILGLVPPVAGCDINRGIVSPPAP